MKIPGIPRNDAERVALLRSILILDTDPEDRYDIITSYCQSRFGVAIAVVSLVDADRQWFKSICGLDAKETPRAISFCGHAILEDKVMEVRDALLDDRFADNPLVTGPPHIRYYAGAPLKHSSGHILGTLCLIDSRPKRLPSEELEHLAVLAHVVTMEIENQPKIDDCTEYCIYDRLPAECPDKDTKHDIPK